MYNSRRFVLLAAVDLDATVIQFAPTATAVAAGREAVGAARELPAGAASSPLADAAAGADAADLRDNDFAHDEDFDLDKKMEPDVPDALDESPLPTGGPGATGGASPSGAGAAAPSATGAARPTRVHTLTSGLLAALAKNGDLGGDDSDGASEDELDVKRAPRAVRHRVVKDMDSVDVGRCYALQRLVNSCVVRRGTDRTAGRFRRVKLVEMVGALPDLQLDCVSAGDVAAVHEEDGDGAESVRLYYVESVHTRESNTHNMHKAARVSRDDAYAQMSVTALQPAAPGGGDAPGPELGTSGQPARTSTNQRIYRLLVGDVANPPNKAVPLDQLMWVVDVESTPGDSDQYLLSAESEQALLAALQADQPLSSGKRSAPAPVRSKAKKRKFDPIVVEVVEAAQRKAKALVVPHPDATRVQPRCGAREVEYRGLGGR